MSDRRALRVGCAAALMALLALSACGGTGRSSVNLTTGTTVVGASDAPSPSPAGVGSDPVRIRLALAPDPIWQWLEDSGTVAVWEQSRNIRIEASNPFDQFAAFAGGHADVVVINALDVPKFVEQPGRDPVIIGKYTFDRSILAVSRTSQAEDLGDLVEARIAVESSLASTLLWGLIADSMFGLDFRPDSDDFDIVTVEPASVADLVIRGDVDACICTPDFSVPYLASGRLRPLYDGRSAAEIYATDVVGNPATLPLADAFVVDKDWHTQNPEAVDALLALWEKGLESWKLHKTQIIADLPHHFSVQTAEEIAWITDYINDHDWVVPSVYIRGAEAATHSDTFARMQAIGLVPAGAAEPEIDLSYSSELSALEEVLKPGADQDGSGGDLDRLSTRLSTPDEEGG